MASQQSKLRVLVAVSGGGRSLENLLDRQDKEFFEIVGVISSRPDCRGVDIAKSAHLPVLVCDFSPTRRSPKLAAEIEDFATIHRANLVALAGFLKPYPVSRAWERRVVNIHPALLPRHGGKGMYGMKVHEAVLAARETRSGDEIDEAKGDALRWALERGSRSGRVAHQFARDWAGRSPQSSSDA